MFESWKNSVLGKVLDTDHVVADNGQCSQVPVSWAETLFPGVNWPELLPEVGSNAGVDEWAGKSTKYFTWIENNHNDINQLPLQGDIMVFGATPAAGYSDTYPNPYGHTGVCDSASASGYTLVQQNAPNFGSAVNDTSYPWHMRPCLGWFRSVNAPASAPNPAPAVPPTNSVNVGRTLHLPGSISAWHVYNVAGPYDLAHATHVLDPAQFGGLSYEIQKDLGNGIYVINTQMFGQVAIWTSNTVATVTDDAAPAAAPAAPSAPADQEITVKKGWGLEAVADAAGRPDAAQPSCWQAIAEANGNNDWHNFNANLQPGQVVKVPAA